MYAQEAVSAPKGFDVGLMCAGCMLRLRLCEVQIGFDVGLMANLLNTAWARLTHMVRNHLFMIMSGDNIERLRLPDLATLQLMWLKRLPNMPQLLSISQSKDKKIAKGTRSPSH